MTDPLTEEDGTAAFHGGLGLAVLISELASARSREKGCSSHCQIYPGENFSGPIDRGQAEEFSETWLASAEYYRICDRIARGERP